MAKIEIKSQGSARVYEVLDELVTIGRDEKNHIRLKDASASLFEARLVRGTSGWRIEAAEEGRKFTVNGLTVRAADLEPGDKVGLGNVELMFVSGDGDAAPAQAPAVGQPAAPHAPASRSSASRTGPQRARAHAPASAGHARADDRSSGARHARQLRDPSPMSGQKVGIIVSILSLSILAVYLVYKLLTSEGLANDPKETFKDAVKLVAEGSNDAAERKLVLIETRSPDAALRLEIDRLRQTMKASGSRALDQQRISNAGNDRDVIKKFCSDWLAKEPWKREHARELMRISKQWMDKYKDLGAKYEDIRENYSKEIEQLMAKATPIAQMETPENKTDMLFRADRMTRYKGRSRWKEAIEMIDAFLARDPDAEVKATRRSRYKQGKEAMDDYMRMAEERIGLGDQEKIKDSIEILEFMVTTGAMPEWRPEIQKKLDQLKAAAK